MSRIPLKEGLHPRNRFRNGYEFDRLIACCAVLADFVTPNAYGNASIDYSDPAAVKALNQALLADAYGLDAWDIPNGSLCPPVPGRSDHLHHLADLLAGDDASGAVPRGPSIVVLDIGTGANCIYPLIGASEYGWRFVASETAPSAWDWAAKLVAAHPDVADLIDCRMQSSAKRCFEGVVKADEVFDLSICNPPFYASAAEAAAGNRRKRRNLHGKAGTQPMRNFGGQASELWCPGGELGFVERLIKQSADRPAQCRWTTSLVSRSEHLPRLERALQDAQAVEVRTLEMAHGQKKSRILAWTFMSKAQRRAAQTTDTPSPSA